MLTLLTTGRGFRILSPSEEGQSRFSYWTHLKLRPAMLSPHRVMYPVFFLGITMVIKIRTVSDKPIPLTVQAYITPS